jgi:hypothetical protein
MALKKSQKSLRAWTKQKWRTKSGKPSTQGSKATGEDISQKKQLRIYQRKSMLQHREQRKKEQKLANSLLSNQKELRKKQKNFVR